MNDNLIAIKILQQATDLIRAIEHDDVTYIKSDIKNLKELISEFEEVFYEQKAMGVYGNNQNIIRSCDNCKYGHDSSLCFAEPCKNTSRWELNRGDD